jgi:hypothetical protein
MMASEYRFLQSFSKKAQEYGYNYKHDESEIAVRITANKPDGPSGKISPSSHISSPEFSLIGHRPEDTRNKTIYQRDLDASNLTEAESDLHRRSVFISSHVANNKNYTKPYDKVVVGEYTDMIARARGMKAARKFRHDKMQDDEGIAITGFGKKKIEKDLSEQEEKKEESIKLSDEELKAFEDAATIFFKEHDNSVSKQAEKLHAARIEYEREIKKGGDRNGRGG